MDTKWYILLAFIISIILIIPVQAMIIQVPVDSSTIQGEISGAVDNNVENRPAWLLEFKKTLAWPGRQHIYVPVFMSNLEPVNSFEILFDYDPTVLTFIGVSDICSGCDRIMVHACDVSDPGCFEWKYPLFDENYRPEYFNFTHGVSSHPNWVRVVGIMDMDWPLTVTSPIAPDSQQMIFCAIFDMSPFWDEEEVFSNFHMTNCTDNTLTDTTGYNFWGPNADELPGSLNCAFDSVIVLWDGHDGCPIIGLGVYHQGTSTVT